jgi:putative endonuclease
MSKEEPWYVYIIECFDKTLYTGISNNVSKRVLKHNSGKGAKYTRNKLPVALKWFKECNNKSEAAKEEYRIKKLTRGNKLELIKEFTV